MLNNKKSIIIFSCIVIVAIIVVFLFGSNITRLLGNIYNVDEIGSNIDNIKSGDKINYSANGIDDWQVLNIDKDNNTIEIISTKPVEDLELKGYEGWINAKQKMLEIANKYVVGDYAIGARNLNLNDITSSNISFSGCIWLDDQIVGKYNYSDIVNSYTQKYYCRGETMAGDYSFLSIWGNMQVMVIVNIADQDASSYSVGDDYIYSSNGIENWKVLRVNSANDLLIVSADGQFIDWATNDRISDGTATINDYLLDFYDNDDVLNVRIANYGDASDLVAAGIKNNNSVITGFNGYSYSGNYTNFFTSDPNDAYTYSVNYDNYSYSYMYYAEWGNASYRSSGSTFSIYSTSYGVRPVIKLKYSVNGGNVESELNTDVKIGDNVIYEGNSYKNWKVLSINKEDNTAEIVSAGIVQLLTLKGMDDYDNLESIFQEIVDDYMEGDNVISARMLTSDDIEKLSLIKDRYSGSYWLNNKLVYKYKNGISSYENQDIYGVAIGSYNTDSLNVIRQWVPLEIKQATSLDGFFSIMRVGTHEYTAGIRPVIKVGLSYLVKDDDVKNDNQEAENVVVPENKENPVLDENIISNNQDETNNTKVDDNSDEVLEKDENLSSCIVYDTVKDDIDKQNSNKVDTNYLDNNNSFVSNNVLILTVIVTSIVSSSIVGVMVYRIVKKKFSIS